MKRFILVIVFFISLYNMPAQKDTEKFVTAIVECLDVQQTGKRHNSYFFSFKIKEILDGEIKDSIVSSQELYHDFGGGQILGKLKPNNNIGSYGKGPFKELLVIHFTYDGKIESLPHYKLSPDTLPKAGHWCKLKWAAEIGRRKSLENLEAYLKKKIKKQEVFDQINFLQERNGKLWFLNDLGKPQIAIETPFGSGKWGIKNQ